MVSIARTDAVPGTLSPNRIIWLAAAAGLATMVAGLTVAVKINPVSSLDVAVLDWVAGWDFPGLAGAFGVLSFLTSAYAGLLCTVPSG